MSRCDLHIHSKFSDRSEDWLFRRFDFPDSYTDPLALYDQLCERGMDFVTITDHDTIEGCLAIQDKPHTFISEQVTTYFPQDPCKVHLLVWQITDAQHRVIAACRSNIFELQKFLAAEGIAHAVAHPLYSVNGKLEASQLERLILLFKCFEGVNGLRDALLGTLTQELMSGLNKERVEEYAERHQLAPTHPEPWRKILIGGSDDHGGQFPASAFTETPPARDATQFLDHVRTGRCEPRGEGGTPIALSHGFYNIVSQFIQERFHEKLGPSAGLLEKMFSRFMEGRDPTEFSLREKASFVAQGLVSGKIFELAKPANVSLWKELSSSFNQPAVKEKLTRQLESVPEPERRAFLFANIVSEQLAFRFFEKFVKQISAGNVVESLQAISAIAPLVVILSPYIYAFHSQAPSRAWLRDVFQKMTGGTPELLRNRKRAWFTDTLEDVNGVATTIRKMSAAAQEAGADLTVVTSRREIHLSGIPIKNFEPIGEFELPEYELQKLSFPPILQMLDYIQREQFTEIIISTPGPIGLTALLAAKMLNLSTSGIYHTDFPQYVRILTDDSFLESVAWKFMHWFYGQLDTVFVNSEEYRRSWIKRGFSPDKLKILPRGLDTALFTPERRDLKFWQRYRQQNGAVRLLYVGRISKEKDLDILAEAYRQLKKEGLSLQLFFVGDGPYLQELTKSLPDAIFTGYLRGPELATAYASADVFVFPSTTDTFGNVVIEAQAAGIPVIVSDTGGPKELVEAEVSGLVTRSHDAADLARAIRELAQDEKKRAALGQRGRAAVVDRSWPGAFRRFWAATDF